MCKVRNSAKALIQKENKILLVQYEDEEGFWHTLPGGGQRQGETLTEAVKRECLEEVNAQVDVGELLFIREYIADNHEFAGMKPGFHQVEFIFKCSLLEGSTISPGSEPDIRQVGISWVNVHDLAQQRVYPKVWRELIPNIKNQVHPIYLGDVN